MTMGFVYLVSTGKVVTTVLTRKELTMNMSSQIHQRMRSQIASPKTGESNRGQRITAPREKLQEPGGQVHWKGASQGWAWAWTSLRQNSGASPYRVPGLLELYLQEAP